MGDWSCQNQPPDFVKLADVYPDSFGKHVKYAAGGKQAYIDFHDPEAVRSLTRVLLLHDLGVHVELPEDRLCPPIPNRLNYILWIKNVLEDTRSPSDGRSVAEFSGLKEDRTTDEQRPAKRARRNEGQHPDPTSNTPRTLDIGTGAIAVYPLLGCSFAPRWNFVATDIDETSLASAARVLTDSRNSTTAKRHGAPLHLAQRIKLVHRSPGDALIPIDGDDDLLYHATMCNPPFFSGAAEMASNLQSKAGPPNAVCSGTHGEMITAGGEVAFVTRMIDESLSLKERVMWYTSLLGKLSSVPALLQILKERGVDNYGATEFVQGQTRRWAIIWGFTKYRLPDTLVRIAHPTVAKLLPGATSVSRDLERTAYTSASSAIAAFRSFVESLSEDVMVVNPPKDDISSQSDNVASTHQVYARFKKNVWNRAARRAAKKAASGSKTQEPDEDSDPILGITFSATVSEVTEAVAITGEHENSLIVTATLQWTYGKSRADFDSFASATLRALSLPYAGATSKHSM